MSTKDPRVDAYIARSADFAKPILEQIREVVHAACPEVRETIKWGFPNFDYHGIMCSMAAFKAHCTFGFWKHSLILPAGSSTQVDQAMGSFGRITTISDLPSTSKLEQYIRKAMELNETGVKAPHMVNRKPRKHLEAPAYLLAAIRQNEKALATYEALSPSHRREYIEWVTEAKTEPTRQKRVATTVAWLAEGKSRNWKYQRGK